MLEYKGKNFLEVCWYVTMFVHIKIGAQNCLQNAAIMKKEIWLFFKDIIPVKTPVAFFIHPSANKITSLKFFECCNQLKNYKMNTT